MNNNFTFNNFDELKGFLKGKSIVANNKRDSEALLEILKKLEFKHEPKLVEIPEWASESRIFYINDTDFTRDFFKKYQVADLDGYEVIEEYYQLKEQLIYSIIPYPITIAEARNMSAGKLSAICGFSEDLLDKIESWDLDDKDVEALLADVNQVRTIVDNYEIQSDNLKYIE